MQDQEYHESLLLPTPIETPQPTPSDPTLGSFALVANIAITTIIIVAMLIDGTTARTAIIVGACYYAISTIAFAGVTTGALTSIINSYQREHTERERIRAYLALGTQTLSWRLAVEQNRRDEVGGMKDETSLPSSFILHPSSLTEGVQRLSPIGTFVAPYADEQLAAREAVAWAEKLYDRHPPHAPDPRKVHMDGRLKQRMIGSKRGHGNRESGVWLIRNGVIQRVAGGYALRTDQFPFRHYVSALLRA